MRALIPVTQEDIPWKSIERAKVLCDEVTLLYVVERKLVDLVEAEASYIIPHHALEDTENIALFLQKERAMKIHKELEDSGIKTEMVFGVGNYFHMIEKEIGDRRVDMLMVDRYTKRLSKIDIPVWVDRGGLIRECVFVVSSAVMLRKLRRRIDFAEKVCEKLGCRLRFYYTGADESVIKTLQKYGSMVRALRGDLICISISDKISKRFKNIEVNLILFQ